MSHEILVLTEQVEVSQLEEIADRRGWVRSGETVRSHFVLASRRYRDQDDTLIEYFEDHIGEVRFIQISGPSQSPLFDILADALPVHSEEQLIADLEHTVKPLAWIRGLSRLAVCHPAKATPTYLGIWAKGLRHPHKAARRAAVRTAYSCRWPELVEIVIARLETDAELRGPLQHLLEFLNRDIEQACTPEA